MRRAQGEIRDAIMNHFKAAKRDSTVAEIRASVEKVLGPVPMSSVRSYLGNNTPGKFTRVEHATYRLRQALD